MTGIPTPLYVRLRQTLLDCGRFDNEQRLRSIFANELLAPWRYQLPQADTITDRVDITINFLIDKRRSDSQMNALVIFLTVLRDTTDPNDAFFKRLGDLIQELSSLLDASHSVEAITSVGAGATSSKSARSSAFISYSHKDKKYLEELQIHLAHYVRVEHLDIWDDSKIPVGSKWRQQIEQAIESAKVVVLLISANFLASDFIATKELPPLLAAAEREGVIILPVILKACAFQDSSLAQFQAVNTPSTPLATMTPARRDEVWSKVAKLVSEALSKIQ